LTVVLRGGRRLQGRCEVIRGEPAHPADPQDYKDKFMALAARVWPASRLETLYQQARHPDSLASLRGWGQAPSP
jgi:hypothetical protein